MDLAVISILFLVAAIFIGFKFGLNTGFVAIGLSLIIGTMGGIPSKNLIQAFSSNLFIIMLGVSFMFAIASDNGTLELVAKKLIRLSGKNTGVIPILVFLISAVLAGIGPGTVPVMGIMSTFAVSVAISMKMNPVLLASAALLGSQAGGLTPIAPTGILAQELANQAKLGDLGVSVMLNQFVASFIYFMVLYVVFKGWKQQDISVSDEEVLVFNRNHIITIIAIIAMIILVLGFNYNVGLVCFLLGSILLLFRASTTKAAMNNIAWSTLMLVCGVNILMNVVIKLGGIDLIAKALASIMVPFTAVPIMGVSAGIMSWFSSTSGVVMPTMIPTIPGIMESLGVTNFTAFVSAIVITSHTAGCSPISTGGAQSLAAYSTLTHASDEQEKEIFNKLFEVAIGGVIFMAAYGLLGGFNLF